MAEPFYTQMQDTSSNQPHLPKVPIMFIWLYGKMKIVYELDCFMGFLKNL